MGIPATLSSVPAQTPYIQYVATSGQTVFPYPFEITQDSDLVVVDNGTTYGTDAGYTVSGVGNPTGGNVTLNTGAAAGDIITLYRDIPIERLTQFAQNGGFSSTAFNAEFNNIYLLLQQLQQNLDQCLRIPNTNNPAPVTLLAPGSYASKYLAFDSNGNPTPALLTPSGSITQSILSELLNPQTTLEQDAGVTPANYVYAPLDVRRYGADPAGVIDSTAAFTDLFAVLLEAGGGAAIVPPGTYKISSTLSVQLTPSSGANAESQGLILYAHGAVFNYTGTGYAFDIASANTSATFHGPLLSVIGAELVGTSAASGGWRTRSVSAVHWWDCFVQGFTGGPAWTVLNDVAWSENNHWRSCGAVDCQTIIAFQKTGGTDSFARTYVDGMFGAGIQNYWFDIAGGCSVYDSRFTHISGNFSSLGLFAVGTSSGNPADMTASVVDGIDTEVNGTLTVAFTAGLSSGATSGTLTAGWVYPTGSYTFTFSDSETKVVSCTNGSTSVSWTGGLSSNVSASATIQQGLFVLRDYPQNSGTARRPVVYNMGTYANNSGTLPLWLTGAGAQATLESAQTQPLSALTTLTAYEPNFGAGQILTVPTTDNNVVSGVTLTGFGSAPSGRIAVYRNGPIAVIKVYDTLTGTSNSTSMTLTTLPAEFRPADTRIVPCFVEDNGVQVVPAYASIASNGVVTFAIATAFNNYSASGFTASGTKGLNAGLVITYPLN